ncbi:tRNA (N6-threonylcarbamoyladenosine(37)-N6)-methyltransferase TrmO [Lentisphaerota bacterium ZTH]|nr:tRNA (N6-threonylcarbamoyladenosine(37)-N6)-methyltransferase TrmO [Lentisphaerota bacterium]WET06163.1 tRNA (N6-threonylcarbamoyladenosine(37)-N6)-methyltransferase TrmO [Lentisphaerota bacterium ZTH]
MTDDAQKFAFTAIGYVRCEQNYRYEAPRQAVFAENEGCIELLSGHNYEQAARDLKGFERIWVIFAFHLNEGWRPLVHPPIAPPGRKISVFATRAPYRPNSIGMSCVELTKVEGRKLYICNFDLLDGSPVLDIKPYIPQADAFPQAVTGWLEEAQGEEYEVKIAPAALKMMHWIKAESGLDMENFALLQLGINPLAGKRKRIFTAPDDPEQLEIGCRTWRIGFKIYRTPHIINVKYIRSNYTDEELRPETQDHYKDKNLHRKFIKKKFV